MKSSTSLSRFLKGYELELQRKSVHVRIENKQANNQNLIQTRRRDVEVLVKSNETLSITLQTQQVEPKGVN